mmetsp:Transcript_13200/g.14454  ORF Transcript_13200/g.14454 Transcript_13200/m.14454 type:complete len:82 (-) Transcript_13200:19-264(-)
MIVTVVVVCYQVQQQHQQQQEQSHKKSVDLFAHNCKFPNNTHHTTPTKHKQDDEHEHDSFGGFHCYRVGLRQKSGPSWSTT